MPLAVGHLIDADGLQRPDPVPISDASDSSMEDVGERRKGKMEQASSCLLGHQLGVDQHRVLEAVGLKMQLL